MPMPLSRCRHGCVLLPWLNLFYPRRRFLASRWIADVGCLIPLIFQVLQDEYLFEPEPSFDSAPNSPDLSFQPYQSTLSSYPLLRAQVTPPRLLASDALPSDFFTEDNNGFRSTLVSDAYSHLPTLVLPDLQPLKLATVMKYLDPSKRLCQYEVPGGGVCRDEGCDDVHLTRLPMGIDEEVAEPSDQETANFLLGAVPFEWQARNNATVGKMIAALTLVRQSASLMTLSFEERVRRALLVLEPPPPVPKTS
ncbi:hypothetical protein P691DRAFT_458231 [Macrolepiota fuliginosa MF-IS2]|uniref:Zinc-finger domain-containing protein n=1 Tax=Macrolepiota fuliginosa MF-IS2 TaxID=1400762 RepID=A0A9P5XJZ1_9AGAR|nr:hypothetical protein P691DRAFT_458231 [Macrolepiota fuliginosa MF-IS2]